MKEYARVEAEGRAALSAWLAEHHAQNAPIWLVTVKKGKGEGYIPYGEIVEEALRFGWIDSLPRKLDETRAMLLLSPRKPGSAWSKANRERVARLIEAGAMMPAGMAKVEAAKADGSWDRLKASESGAVPSDLAAALRGERDATAGWDGFTDAVRRRALEQVLAAKRAETRAARIAKVVAGAAKGVDPTKWTRR